MKSGIIKIQKASSKYKRSHFERIPYVKNYKYLGIHMD